MSTKKLMKQIDRALEALSPAETDVVEGAWIRERRPGQMTVRAVARPLSEGGGVELLSSDRTALVEVETELHNRPSRTIATEISKITREEADYVFGRALARGDLGTPSLLRSAERKVKRARRRKGR